MSSWHTILITGATDGIGLALAHHYRAQEKQLILIGRRPFEDVPLAEFGPDSYCQADLSRPDCAEKVSRWLDRQQIWHIDLLIHNAATGYYGPTEQQPAQNIRDITAVNLQAPIALTHYLLPRLPRPGGKIVFISSVVSALACPDYAVYGASKAALDGFARNLRIELKSDIEVQVVYPGATRTGMHAKSGIRREDMDWEQFPPATEVAAKIERAIARSRKSATIGLGNRLLQIGGRHLGGLIDAVMRRRYR